MGLKPRKSKVLGFWHGAGSVAWVAPAGNCISSPLKLPDGSLWKNCPTNGNVPAGRPKEPLASLFPWIRPSWTTSLSGVPFSISNSVKAKLVAGRHLQVSSNVCTQVNESERIPFPFIIQAIPDVRGCEWTDKVPTSHPTSWILEGCINSRPGRTYREGSYIWGGVRRQPHNH